MKVYVVYTIEGDDSGTTIYWAFTSPEAAMRKVEAEVQALDDDPAGYRWGGDDWYRWYGHPQNWTIWVVKRLLVEVV